VHPYVVTYLENLPPELRPDLVNDKILNALRVAWKNKWEAQDLAKAVCSSNYQNSANPAGYAVYRLTQIAEQPAFVKKVRKVKTEVEKFDKVSPELIAARHALVRRIMAEKIPAEEASRLMNELAEEHKTK